MLEAVASFALCVLFFGCILIQIGAFADTVGTTAEGQNLPDSFLRNSRVGHDAVQATHETSSWLPLPLQWPER